MSYDLAIWPGPRPASDDAAADEYERQTERAEQSDAPPTPVISAYLDDLIAKFADQEGNPWAGPPETVGAFVIMSFVRDEAQEALRICAQVAGKHGLICFDPQVGKLAN